MTDDPMPPTVNQLPPKAQGLIARVQAILMKPAATWDVIAAEPSSIQSIYMGYVLPLAAIGPICRAIGMSVIGVGAFGFSYHMPIMWAVIEAVVMYVLGLVMLYVQAFIIDMLAPSFDGQRNILAAFKLAAYSMTAAWIVGVVGLIPMLGILGLAGLYSCYLFWIGLPKLMKSPTEKTPVYVIVIIVVSIIASIIPAMVAGAVTGMAGLGTAMSGYHGGAFGSNNGTVNGTFTVQGKDGSATMDLGKMEAAANQMAAQASAAQNGTAAPVKLADASALQGLMPQSYMGAAISNTSTESGGAAGIQASTAEGHYTVGDGSLTLKISDLGSMAGFGAMANAMNVNASSSSGTSYSKTTTDGNRIVSESYDSADKNGEYSVVLNGRITVTADGNGVDMNAIKGLANSVDINHAMSLTQ